jgi:hypothetical protein
MRNRFSGFLWFAVMVMLFAAPGAFGQANLYLNDAGNNVMDGVYVGPYNATINGTSGQQIICDDFADETNVGESWIANVTTLSNLSGTKWGSSSPSSFWGGSYSALQGYEAMMALSSQMLGNKNPNQVGDLAYAVWAIFNGSAVYNWLISHGDGAAWGAVQSMVTAALKGSYSIAQFAGWQIFTPTKCLSNCTGIGGLPQEFLEYNPLNVPEGGTAISYLLVGLFTCLMAMVYRRRQVQA